MEKPTLDLLVRRTVSDPAFRAHLLADPQVAIQDAGWDFSPEEMAALKAWHANLHDVTKVEELERSLLAFVAERTPTGY